jgi:hypothetical protein
MAMKSWRFVHEPTRHDGQGTVASLSPARGAAGVNRWRHSHLAIGLAMAGMCAGAADGARPEGVIQKLATTGEVACQPALPFYCGNMHVSCAGLTSIATFPFKLRATAVVGTIESAPGTESVRGPFENGRVDWEPAGAYVIVSPRSGSGYIKLLADGSYSFRHYAQHGAAMSLGRCE